MYYSKSNKHLPFIGVVAKGRFMVHQTKSGDNASNSGVDGATTSDSTPSPAGSNYTTASESGNNPPPDAGAATVATAATVAEAAVAVSTSREEQRLADGLQPQSQIQRDLEMLREQLKQMHFHQPQHQHPRQPPPQQVPTKQPPSQPSFPPSQQQALQGSLPHAYNTVGGVPAASAVAPASSAANAAAATPEQQSQQFQALSDQQPAMQQLSQHQQHVLLQQQSATHSLPPASPSQLQLQQQAMQHRGTSLAENDAVSVQYIQINCNLSSLAHYPESLLATSLTDPLPTTPTPIPIPGTDLHTYYCGGHTQSEKEEEEEEDDDASPTLMVGRHLLAERTRSYHDYSHWRQNSAGMPSGSPALRRTVSFDHGGGGSRPEHPNAAGAAAKRGSNPDLAWKELNEGLNSLFHVGTPLPSPPREVFRKQRHQSATAPPPPPPPQRKQGFLLCPPPPPPPFPLRFRHRHAGLRKSYSRPSLTSLDDEDEDDESIAPSPTAAVVGSAEVYHTVHGVGAGRKKTLLASRRNEPFAKIIRHRAPASVLLSADAMPSLKEHLSNAPSSEAPFGWGRETSGREGWHFWVRREERVKLGVALFGRGTLLLRICGKRNEKCACFLLLSPKVHSGFLFCIFSGPSYSYIRHFIRHA